MLLGLLLSATISNVTAPVLLLTVVQPLLHEVLYIYIYIYIYIYRYRYRYMHIDIDIDIGIDR